MNAPILVESADGIARLTFNRPERLNAIDVEMAEAFASAVETVLRDSAIRVILLTAKGRAFVAGGDLASFRSAADKVAMADAIIGPMHKGLKRLAEAPAIVLCAAHGAIAGAGMSILSFVDLAIVAEDATFNMAYARVGVPPDCGGSWALPRIVGLRRALELALLAETIDAAEALRLGLVNRVVPRPLLEEEALKTATRLAKAAPAAMARTKMLMRGAFTTAVDEHLDAERSGFASCAATEDFIEALDAFFGKRSPRFTGR
ncbi:enoyl-CoA hydratase/isomerase family protein [Microvirga puerhi]|uniref:Enoyl-CoA hydratase/isomerase family protein n=1 Tax=Microvirga puerhi TaxID=2876078 RepID=A0ABS7VTR5_9HYPH|nr:enoyl-CoA hydratase-related protein [Microvirga puerhi]MBZ6078490.1 enoyl-CoA hydratase/isomerase family protein [Microvirga puerhi]